MDIIGNIPSWMWVVGVVAVLLYVVLRRKK